MLEVGQLTLSMWWGQFCPVASTGMSSYFSKLIPVLLPENNSLHTHTQTEHTHTHIRKHTQTETQTHTHTQLMNRTPQNLLGPGSGTTDSLFQTLVPLRGFGPVPVVSGLLHPAAVPGPPRSESAVFIPGTARRLKRRLKRREPSGVRRLTFLCWRSRGR